MPLVCVLVFEGTRDDVAKCRVLQDATYQFCDPLWQEGFSAFL
jgi:hypothetical protein